MIESFARHPVAANLLMLIALAVGWFAATTITTSLDPKLDLPYIEAQFTWPGASAEDVEQLVTRPVELALRATPHMTKVESISRPGWVLLILEFDHDTDMTLALDRVKQRIDGVRDLPPDLEPPQISRVQDVEFIASVLLSGGSSLVELQPLARAMERELLTNGVDRVEFAGLPAEEIAIQVSTRALRTLGTSLDAIAADVGAQSSNVPAGMVGRDQGQRQLRSLAQERDPSGFAGITIGGESSLLRLGDIARIERRPRDDQQTVLSNGKPAIELTLMRNTESDAIDASRRVRDWIERTRANLPPGVELTIYQEAGRLLEDQLALVFANALQSLVLVIATLLLFLNLRTAAWIAAGIPVAVLLGLAFYLWGFGGSINILALLAFIMVLGIVVDDAIVVAEETTTLASAGASPLDAALQGARRMFVPVLASSLTTLAAFAPLLLIGGVMGDIVLTVPQVLLCVIVASLIECFLILPAHLRGRQQADAHSLHPREQVFRTWFDSRFTRFRDGRFTAALRVALAYPGATLAIACMTTLLGFALLAGRYVELNLVTGVSLDALRVNVEFAATATEQQKRAFLGELEQSLRATDTSAGETATQRNVTAHLVRTRTAEFDDLDKRGGEFAMVDVAYAFAEDRTREPREFLADWEARVTQPGFVERLSFEIEGGANNGRPPLSFVVRGSDSAALVRASAELGNVLARYPGVRNVRDDVPYGKEQWVFELTPQGRTLGLTNEALGRQLRSAFNGRRVQLIAEQDAELEVRVVLPDEERDSVHALRQFPIRTQSGAIVPLDAVATLAARRGIDELRHDRGELAVRVNADVDEAAGNAHSTLEDVEANVLPGIAARHGVAFGLAGDAEQDARLLATLGSGALLTFLFMYAVLVWTLRSYLWPLAIMLAIPFGIAGAIAGHFFLGIDLGAMSLLALFALTGIVVNDAIVLVCRFRELLEAGESVTRAALLAATSRLRAVLLTTLTTTAGLASLMFQESTLALYIQPIATTICFGLGWATLLVLFVVPALLVLVDAARQRVSSWFTRGAIGTARLEQEIAK